MYSGITGQALQDRVTEQERVCSFHFGRRVVKYERVEHAHVRGLQASHDVRIRRRGCGGGEAQMPCGVSCALTSRQTLPHVRHSSRGDPMAARLHTCTVRRHEINKTRVNRNWDERELATFYTFLPVLIGTDSTTCFS